MMIHTTSNQSTFTTNQNFSEIFLSIRWRQTFELIFSLFARISYERDTKVPNAGIFVIRKEDHTLGNLLKK